MRLKFQTVRPKLPQIVTAAASLKVPQMTRQIQEQLQIKQEKNDSEKAKPIGYYKGGVTAPYVQRKKRRTGISIYFAPPRVDLWLTGDFNKEIKVAVDGGKYEISSSKSYAKHLEKRYGEGILDYTPESRMELGKEIMPEVVNNIKKSLQ
jgi:hypothetical protein